MGPPVLEWLEERGLLFVVEVGEREGVFFVDGSGRNTMRLTFAKESDARLKEGVERLARVFV